MGQKGSKTSEESIRTAELITDTLSVFDGITSKKMFGGHGIFCEGSMFGIVDPKGVAYFKVDDSNRDDYEAAGSTLHGRMPYYTIPIEVLNTPESLVLWAEKSISLAKKA